MESLERYENLLPGSLRKQLEQRLIFTKELVQDVGRR